MVGAGCHPVLASYVGMKSNSSVVSTWNKGFGVSMSTMGEIWVQDPTRILIFEYKPDVRI